jgi:hypothetical protein
MQYSYKTHKLLDEGVNFGKVYSDKQEVVKEMTGFDFNLSNIVSFLKKETDNFTKTNIELALDLDRHIYTIYLKWVKEGSQSTPRQTPIETPIDAPIDAVDENAENIEAIALLEELASIQKGKEKKETLEAIGFMKELLNELLNA